MPKKKSKHRNTADRSHEEIVFKDDDQHYAHVTKSLGGGRFELVCDDGITRIGKLRGSMRKSEWVSSGSVVLISLREFAEVGANSKADILLKYSDAAVRQLRRYGELEWMVAHHSKESEDEEDAIVFEDDAGELDLSLV